MTIEERPVALDDVVIDTFYDYRDYGLSWGEAIDQTADEVGMSYDQVENVLIKNKIYEAEDKEDKKNTEDNDEDDKKDSEKKSDDKKEEEAEDKEKDDKEKDDKKSSDEKEEKSCDKKESVVIEIDEETQLPGTDIILEKGDKIEILKESDWLGISDEFFSFIERTYNKGGVKYTARELFTLIDNIKTDMNLEYGLEGDIEDLNIFLKAITDTASKYAR